MSLFSKIGKGLKKITLRKSLPYLAGAAVLAIPGVGPLAAGVAAKAASGIGKAAKTGGQIVRSVATGAASAAGAIAGEAVQTIGTVSGARTQIAHDVNAVGASVGEMETAATTGTIMGGLKAIPPVVWIIAAGVLVLVFFKRGRK